jgi:hypothetical protein
VTASPESVQLAIAAALAASEKLAEDIIAIDVPAYLKKSTFGSPRFADKLR